MAKLFLISLLVFTFGCTPPMTNQEKRVAINKCHEFGFEAIDLTTVVACVYIEPEKDCN